MAAAKVKRTSGQAALDDSPRRSPHTPHVNLRNLPGPDDRPILPIPKRARLRRGPVCVPSAPASTSTKQTVQRSSVRLSYATQLAGSSVDISPTSASSSLPSSSAPPSAGTQYARGLRSRMVEGMLLLSDLSTDSEDEADNRDERSNAEDTPPIPWKERLRRRTVPDILIDSSSGGTATQS